MRHKCLTRPSDPHVYAHGMHLQLKCVRAEQAAPLRIRVPQLHQTTRADVITSVQYQTVYQQSTHSWDQ